MPGYGAGMSDTSRYKTSVLYVFCLHFESKVQLEVGVLQPEVSLDLLKGLKYPKVQKSYDSTYVLNQEV